MMLFVVTIVVPMTQQGQERHTSKHDDDEEEPGDLGEGRHHDDPRSKTAPKLGNRPKRRKTLG